MKWYRFTPHVMLTVLIVWMLLTGCGAGAIKSSDLPTAQPSATAQSAFVPATPTSAPTAAPATPQATAEPGAPVWTDQASDTFESARFSLTTDEASQIRP